MERSTWGGGGSEDAEIVRLGRMTQRLRGADGSGLNVHIRTAMLQNADYSVKLGEVCNCIDRLVAQDRLVCLQVAVNCKWGKHRSVSFAEDLGPKLVRWGYTISIYHLEQPRWDGATRKLLRYATDRGFADPFDPREEEVLVGTRAGLLGENVRPRRDAPKGWPTWFRVT